jgi:Flp pilus assembly protein TadD
MTRGGMRTSTRAMRRVAVVLAMATLVAAPRARAQAAPDQADTTAAMRARQALRELERLETGLAIRRDTTDLGRRAAQSRMLATVRATLDTAVLAAPDGGRTLATLQREYPGAAILREYEGWRLLADGEPGEALVRFDGLLRASRRDAALLRGRARALDALRREPDATAAWERVLDAQPASADAFDALWRRHQAASSLRVLHHRIARLRLLHPSDTTLVGREVRLLQALGLPDSAAAVARRFTEGT